MEEKPLNLDAPFLSVRRPPTKPDHSIQSDNTKNKKTTKTSRTKKVLLQQDRSFDHVMEPSSVPFKWEQTPGKPKDLHKIIEESDLIKALDMVSSTASFSVNCSTSGVSDHELEKNAKDDVISEYRDLIMSRFLPDAKAIAFKQKKESQEKIKKESSLHQEKKKKQRIALERVSMAINQDLNNDDVVDQDLHVSKKAPYGFFLPQLCSKNSLDVLNPVLSRVKTCQDLGVKSGNVVNPKSLVSVYRPQQVSSPRISRSSNKVMSKTQEPRISKEVIVRRNPSRLQRTTSDQIQRFLVEEVKRKSQRNKIRSRNLSDASLVTVSQPPLPKTPSESWLCRTLPRSSAVATVITGQSAGIKKMEQKTIKWETMVKTSYKHHDHVRYSQELVVVQPSGQHKY